MSTPRKATGRHASKSSAGDSLKVVRQRDGSFLIGGTKESLLVGKGTNTSAKAAPKSSTRLTSDQIKSLTKRMKVAA